MIPNTIQLKNFLSYGEVQTIDFGPHHLICLAGKNGHGKSALLDAMTWALWGQARKTVGAVKADEGLMRLGSTHTFVVFDFFCNEQHYRVRRECIRTRDKVQTNLDFGIIDDATGKVRSLSEKTIKATQWRISKTIGFEYESFINSVFLRQGHAHEFSRKSPKERKETLSTMLGLSHYETIKKNILEYIREQSAQKDHLLATNNTYEIELQQLPEVEELIDKCEQSLTKGEKEEYHIQQQLHIIGEKKQTIDASYRAYTQATWNYQAAEQEWTSQCHALSQYKHRWRQNRQDRKTLQTGVSQKQKEALEKEREQLLAAYHAQLTVREALHACDQKKQTYAHAWHTKKLEALTACNEQIARVQANYTSITDQQHKITSRLTHLGAQYVSTLKKTTSIQQELCTYNAEKISESYLMRLHGLYHKLKSEKTRFKSRYKKISDTQKHCSWCEQSLTHEAYNRTQSKDKRLYLHIKHQSTRIEKLLPRIKHKITMLHDQEKQLNAAHEAYQKKMTFYRELQKTLEVYCTDYQELKKEWETLEQNKTNYAQEHTLLKQKKASLESRSLDSDSTYQDLKKSWNEYQQQMKNVSYDAAALEQVNAKLQAIAHTHARQEHLNQEYESCKRSIVDICQKLRIIKTSMKELQQKQYEYQHLNNSYFQLQHQEKTYADHYARASQEKARLMQEKGRLTATHAQLKKIQNAYNENKKLLTQLNQDIEDHNTLAHAFGRNGIQALVIEHALPEIEERTNELLQELTDNQTQIIIESLKDLKKGGTKETLDINISDAMGIRSYELFSGGEAFRIDFALRIAISQLLARKAGTALQTLIIDEGFGSQDEEGLSHIIDTLHKIQNHFAKIIVVSHLAAIKDYFPTQIQINKGLTGSVAQIMEQG